MTNELKEFEKSRIALFEGQVYIESGYSLPTLISELKKNSKENTRFLIITDLPTKDLDMSVPKILKLLEGHIQRITHTKGEIEINIEENIKFQILNFNVNKNQYSIRGLGCDHLVIFINRDRSVEFGKSNFFSSLIIPLFVFVNFSILLYGESKYVLTSGEDKTWTCLKVESLSMEDFVRIE